MDDTNKCPVCGNNPCTCPVAEAPTEAPVETPAE
jgi:hypothetical protein